VQLPNYVVAMTVATTKALESIVCRAYIVCITQQLLDTTRLSVTTANISFTVQVKLYFSNPCKLFPTSFLFPDFFPSPFPSFSAAAAEAAGAHDFLIGYNSLKPLPLPGNHWEVSTATCNTLCYRPLCNNYIIYY